MRDPLAELATKELQEKEIDVEPLFPRILVRLVPKEQTKGGILLPGGNQQNKPVHEGIVLKTYKPFWNKYRRMEDWMIVKSPQVLTDEHFGEVKAIWQECEVVPGDHILFPFMAPNITPVWPLDGGIGMYRLIEEGHVLSKVTYDSQSTLQWLTDKLISYSIVEPGTMDGEIKRLAEWILERADVIRKDVESKTLSGA